MTVHAQGPNEPRMLGQGEPIHALRAGSPALAEVVTALNVPADAVASANEFLAAQAARLTSCLVGSETGPWRYRLALDNAQVRAVELVADGTGVAPSTTPLTTCVAEVLRSLRFRRLGRSIEVRVSRRQVFGGAGIGGGGLGGFGAVRGSTGSPPNSGMRSSARTSARVRPGTVNVRGGLAVDIVRRVVRRHVSALRFCYEQALVQQPRAQGSITLELVISADGTVPRTATRDVSAGLDEVAACFARVARRWRFPTPTSAGVVLVRYPFALSPG